MPLTLSIFLDEISVSLYFFHKKSAYLIEVATVNHVRHMSLFKEYAPIYKDFEKDTKEKQNNNYHNISEN